MVKRWLPFCFRFQNCSRVQSTILSLCVLSLVPTTQIHNLCPSLQRAFETCGFEGLDPEQEAG